MDPIDAINRYFYLQTTKHEFTNSIDFEESLIGVNVYEHLLRSVEAYDAMSGIDLAKRAIQSKTLSRKDEVFRVLAFFLKKIDSSHTKPEITAAKHEIYESLPDMFESDTDMLLFIRNYNNKGKCYHFGAGMRRALSKWYLSKTAVELAEMLAKCKSAHKIYHKSVLTNIHISSPDPSQREILNIMFMNGKQIVEKPEPSVAYKTYYDYLTLKRAEPDKVLEILNKKEHNYQLEHLPSKSIKDPVVWTTILPNLTTKIVLDLLLRLDGYKMLKSCRPFSRKLCEFLGDFQNIGSDKLNPFEIFFLTKSYENRSRYSEVLAEEKKDATCSSDDCVNSTPKKNEKTLPRKEQLSNPFLVKKLYELLNYSFGQQDRAGVKFYVTIDFRRFSKSHGKIFNHRSVTCADAQIVAALTWLKTEKEVTLMSFTDDPEKLKPVNFDQDTTYERAIEIYKKHIATHPKTKQRIGLPLKKALDDKIKVDVFITIVDSIARTMGSGVRPPIEALHAYRNGMNIKTTKYVVINMCRKSPDFKYDEKIINSNGILEINGIGPRTLPVIEAFSRNFFD